MPMQKGKKRIHRLVVLPDYQGNGIGTRFITEVSKIVYNRGYDVNLTTTTPALVHSLVRNNNWLLARYGRIKGDYNRFNNKYGLHSEHLNNAVSNKRITYSFWYNRS